jgi:hypothetical protein
MLLDAKPVRWRCIRVLQHPLENTVFALLRDLRSCLADGACDVTIGQEEVLAVTWQSSDPAFTAVSFTQQHL